MVENTNNASFMKIIIKYQEYDKCDISIHNLVCTYMYELDSTHAHNSLHFIDCHPCYKLSFIGISNFSLYRYQEFPLVNSERECEWSMLYLACAVPYTSYFPISANPLLEVTHCLYYRIVLQL